MSFVAGTQTRFGFLKNSAGSLLLKLCTFNYRGEIQNTTMNDHGMGLLLAPPA